MAARKTNKNVPLAVDLDGTLIATDLLWEGIFLLLKKNFLFVFLLPIWALQGKARLKHEIAERVTVDAATLPYRPEFLAFLKKEHAEGRRLVLATAAATPFAEAVAKHLGIFDAVYSTDRYRNLASKAKLKMLVEAFGEDGFDYAGNSRADIAIFDEARKAIVVAPDRAVRAWRRKHNPGSDGDAFFAAPRVRFASYLRMLRVHQWMKNTLVFVPAILAHDILYHDVFGRTFLAFISFCAAASSIYIVNDLFDLQLDRRHARKKKRPFASGELPVWFGVCASGALLALAYGVAALLPTEYMLVLTLYLFVTTAYSAALKRMLLIDVLVLAGLYTVRLLAGAAANATPGSFWLLSFSIFFFLSLALVKRYVELRNAPPEENEKLAGRGYLGHDREVIAQSGVASAFGAVMVLALYIDSDSVRTLYAYPWMIWPLCPIVLYINLRIWILAHRDQMHDDPVVFLLSDWRSIMMILLGGVMLMTAGMR
ncbi:UbiA family prenyltransferase [Phyllobacterium phragmitis]|uniref:UbiA family prenyltransferase n=1 Tax=Phyllobacterium phragmitis TaxID=2670329 RepID=A0A2S9IXA4_9HYPH|nr:UbiA family prenyltransferase [Phyllobacterium phragmitis]PRD45120.1 UbiA family prenyltransferase [Phyllobacterium phragmitis]